jgi:hypothetical protein
MLEWNVWFRSQLEWNGSARGILGAKWFDI